MKALIKKLRMKKGWEGVGYLTLLIVLPAFVGIPIVLWLVGHSE